MSPRALWLAVAALVMLAFPREAEAQSCSTDPVVFETPIVTGPAQSFNVPLRVVCQGNPGRTVRVCIGPFDRTAFGNTDVGRYNIPVAYFGSSGALIQDDLALSIPIAGSGVGVVTETLRIAIGPVSSRIPPSDYMAWRASDTIRASYSTTATCDQSASWPSQLVVFRVIASLSPTCTVATATLDFGTRTLTTVADAQATLAVNCTRETSYSIRLGNGRNGTGPTARRMTNGANSVVYGLYRDASRVLPWGDTAATGITDVGTGLSKSHVVYGRIPAQPLVPPGNYSDVVQVTVVY